MEERWIFNVGVSINEPGPCNRLSRIRLNRCRPGVSMPDSPHGRLFWLLAVGVGKDGRQCPGVWPRRFSPGVLTVRSSSARSPTPILSGSGIRSDVLVTGPHFDPIVPKCIECEAWASRA
jgi:hypothetical protein